MLQLYNNMEEITRSIKYISLMFNIDVKCFFYRDYIRVRYSGFWRSDWEKEIKSITSIEIIINSI